MKAYRILGKVLVLVFALSLFIPAAGLSHEDTVRHVDPEMLSGWLTWIHLTIQWIHLIAFALWLGLTAGVLITLMTSLVLLFHEVADLWPTTLHSMGGILEPEGAQSQMTVRQAFPPPNDFRHLANPAVWLDAGVRWVHLLGFGLWVGAV